MNKSNHCLPSKLHFQHILFIIFIPFVVFFSNTLHADAHAYSASFSTIDLTKSETVLNFSLDENSVMELTGGDPNSNGMMDPEEFEGKRAQIEAILKENLIVAINGEQQNWSRILDWRLERKGEATAMNIVVSYPALSPTQSISFTDNLYLKDNKTNYVNLLTIHYGEQNSTAALSGGNRTWSMLLTENEYEGFKQDLLSTPPVQQSEQPKEVKLTKTDTQTNTDWLSFLKLGMHHILFGYDHLLFLFSLLILKQNFKQLAVVVSSFTIAHTLTLTLTVLGLIQVPSSIVEPIIALSICYVALENIFKKTVNYRWILTFLFGLIHGMGFADILLEMNLPKSNLAADLASFNIGIEIIQLLMVAILLPFITLIHRSKFSKHIVISVSIIAFLLGGIWLVQRLF